MVNIFDTLPRNFFNIFNTADRVVISECICVLYEYIKDDASFASLKENLISKASSDKSLKRDSGTLHVTFAIEGKVRKV